MRKVPEVLEDPILAYDRGTAKGKIKTLSLE